MKTYKITDEVFKTYKKIVNDNSKTSHKDVRKKLTRNLLCGRYIENYTYDSEIEIFGYGYMRIHLYKDTIIHIENRIKPKVQIDKQLKEVLDMELGLGEHKKSFIDKVKYIFKSKIKGE